MSSRPRDLARTRSCSRCGARLQLERQRKYDAFWIILLISLGAALAFYLVGFVLIAAGLWLWLQKNPRWICSRCTSQQSAVV
jgi:uncharacterized protein (DUF983 family)